MRHRGAEKHENAFLSSTLCSFFVFRNPVDHHHPSPSLSPSHQVRSTRRGRRPFLLGCDRPAAAAAEVAARQEAHRNSAIDREEDCCTRRNRFCRLRASLSVSCAESESARCQRYEHTGVGLTAGLRMSCFVFLLLRAVLYRWRIMWLVGFLIDKSFLDE